MEEKNKVCFDDLEFEITKEQKVYFNGNLLTNRNGMITVKKTIKIPVFKLYFAAFGKEDIKSYLGIDSDVKILDEIEGFAINQNSIIYNLTKKTIEEIEGDTFNSFSLNDLAAKYFPELYYEANLIKKLKYGSIEIKKEGLPEGFYFNGRDVFSLEPTTIYPVENDHFSFVKDGVTQYVFLKAVLANG